MSNFNQARDLEAGMQDDESGEGSVENEWLRYAREAHSSSTDFMEASLKKQWEQNMARFHSRHPSGSKYHSDAYRFRSKFFRPKTRAMVRRNEAAAAMAYFSTGDAVNVEPEDEDNDQQSMGADISKELLNYRLAKSIPWFQVLIGAYQETMNIGTVVSYQHWRYVERVEKGSEPVVDEADEPLMGETKDVRIIEDRPVVQLRPPENVLIDEAADWDDPIGTSPFLIDLMPMYVHQVKERMKGEGQDHEPAWHQLTEGEILSATSGNLTAQYDSLRQEREGRERRDSHDNDNNVNDYKIVWVHRNFIRKDGEEWVYYTLGTQHLLSEPVTLYEKYQQDYRPYVMGSCIIEAHRTHPSSASQLGEQAQNEINDTVNERRDNVRLAVNKRFYVRRGANVDYRALMRSAPGSGVLMDDVNQDVKPEQVPDVTGSSYQEQDRLNLDYDEVTGTFSPGSVQSNRKMNETVGGLDLISNDSNVMSEYQLRVFNETWVEPVLRQVLDLEKRYETDETVIAIAGKRASVDTKYGKPLEELSWRDFQAPSTLRVSVGFGATNPRQRIEKMSIGFNTIANFMPHRMQDLDEEEVITETFGALGYKDGKRFFRTLKEGEQEDPRIMQLQQQIQELQQVIQTEQHKTEGKIQVERERQRGAMERERMKLEFQNDMESIKRQLDYIDAQLAAETNEIKRSELLLQQNALKHQQRVTEIRMLQEERNDMRDQVNKLRLEQTGMDDSKAGLLERNDYDQVPYAEG